MNYSKKKGWVRLHRKIEDNFLYFLQPFTKAQAWIDLFLNANHKDGYIEIRGNLIPIKRGQIGWSELTMVKRWNWSKNKVRRFLKLLETEQQIEQQKYLFITTITTILGYEKYQNDTADDTAEGQQTIQQTIHKQECKELKNEKNKILFDIFWKEYPRKIQKSVALKSWIKLNPDDTLLKVILKDIETKKKSEQWLKDKGKFIQYPASYLNQHRWEDEDKGSELEKKPYFIGDPIRESNGQKFVIHKGEWKQYAGRDDQIEWK